MYSDCAARDAATGQDGTMSTTSLHNMTTQQLEEWFDANNGHDYFDIPEGSDADPCSSEGVEYREELLSCCAQIKSGDLDD